MRRRWPVQVFSKQELPGVEEPYFRLLLQQPSSDKAPIDYGRPSWTLHAADGGFMTLQVDADEFAKVQVGDVISIEMAVPD